MDPLDIWRTAHVLIKEYGEEASLIAAKRADALLAQGETEGFAVWTRVVAAIADLERNEPREGESLN